MKITVAFLQASVYPVAVDYGKTVEEMVSAGHYDRKNDDINSRNFPVKGEGTKGTINVNLELVHFNKSVRSKDVLAHLEANGMRPATVEELLAFGATYPEIQREFPIICLGSFWVGPDDDRYMPCLRRGGSRRVLGLNWFGYSWGEVCRFLAVRK